MTYRTIKTPPIPGSVSVEDVESAASELGPARIPRRRARGGGTGRFAGKFHLRSAAKRMARKSFLRRWGAPR